MSSIKMVALRKHPFGTGEREAGEEYEATSDEADTLIALGWAKKAGEKKAAAPAPAPTPAPTAAPAPAPAPEPAAPKRTKDMAAATKPGKRTYERRDMKAKR